MSRTAPLEASIRLDDDDISSPHSLQDRSGHTLRAGILSRLRGVRDRLISHLGRWLNSSLAEGYALRLERLQEKHHNELIAVQIKLAKETARADALDIECEATTKMLARIVAKIESETRAYTQPTPRN